MFEKFKIRRRESNEPSKECQEVYKEKGRADSLIAAAMRCILNAIKIHGELINTNPREKIGAFDLLGYMAKLAQTAESHPLFGSLCEKLGLQRIALAPDVQDAEEESGSPAPEAGDSILQIRRDLQRIKEAILAFVERMRGERTSPAEREAINTFESEGDNEAGSAEQKRLAA